VNKSFFLIWFVGVCVLFGSCAVPKGTECLTGAFLEDKPSIAAIEKFKMDYGKRPAVVLVFLDWGQYPDEAVIRDVYNSGSMLMVTWEPWNAEDKKGIDFPALLAGKDDAYIREFALKLKSIERPVFLRFAHEMNGDWYPWSGMKIGEEVYAEMFRHIWDVFDEAGVRNVRWVFSINTENVPPQNKYTDCYPGDRYVDYIGLDGYNWGSTKDWSRWTSFKDIFFNVYEDVTRRYKKPVVISEFSSTSTGGDKALWIEDALQELKRMPKVKGFILFNVDKETDWRFVPGSKEGRALRKGWDSSYFRDILPGDLK
jgi:endoglucanase